MNLTISIPEDAQCLLKPGQIVDFGTLFLEKKIQSDAIIPISKNLRIAPDKIFKYLKKFVGDSLLKGDVIAEKKGFINSQKIWSEYDGVIKEINHDAGNIVMSTSQTDAKQIGAYFKGEVVEIKKDQVKIKVDQVHEFVIKLASENFGGKALYLLDESNSISEPEAANSVLVRESISLYLKTKAEALGIKGFITLKNPPTAASTPYAQIKNSEDFKKILQHNFTYCLLDKQYSKIYFYK